MFTSHRRTQTISRYRREQERWGARTRRRLKDEENKQENAVRTRHTPVVNNLSGIETLTAMCSKPWSCGWMCGNTSDQDWTPAQLPDGKKAKTNKQKKRLWLQIFTSDYFLFSFRSDVSEKLPVPDPSSPFLNISFSIFICLESFRSSRRRCFDGLSFVTVLISFDYQVCLFWRGGPLRATRLFGGTSRTMNESEHINKRRRNCTDIKAHVCDIM